VSFPALLAEAVLSARSDAIVAADSGGIIRFWNPGAERIFGYSRDEALGRSLDLIVPERLQSGMGRLPAGDGDWSQSLRRKRLLAVPALRKDGTATSVEFTIVPLRENGRLIAIAAIMRDVSKRPLDRHRRDHARCEQTL
jgi:PAS domain S-box-containing protein